jgi:Carboxypeptidase regulatory-like domain
MKLFKVVVLLFVLSLSSRLLAQTFGSMGGVVTDPSGAVIGDAKITATNLGTGAVRSTTTSPSGVYSIPNLAPGKYRVVVAKEGFKSYKFDDFDLTVDQALVLNAHLTLGSLQETVEVNGAEAAPIETQTSQLSNLIDSRTMTDLPLLTRNAYELVLLSPGVIQTNDFAAGFSVNGSRDRNNNFLLDGVDNNDTSVPGGGAGILSINPDSAQEFRVITNNFDPEFGRNTGAIIDVVTRGGTNNFHGDAYWFGRYNALGARDFFNRAPDPQNPYVRNDFGFSVGGPIKKNRTFFFINNEYQRFRTTLSVASTLPTQAFKNGVFTGFSINPVTNAQDPVAVNLTSVASPTNLTGHTPDPTIEKILALLPNPTGANVISNAAGLLTFASPDAFNAYNWTGKIDHKITEKHQLNLRYVFNRSTESNQGHGEFAPGIDLLSVPAYSHGVLAGLTSTLSSKLVNDFRFGWNKNYAAFNSNCGSIFDPIAGLDAAGDGRDFLAPEASFGRGPENAFGCNQLFSSTGQARNTGTTSYTDTLTWVKGNHTIKFGGDFRNVRSTGDANFDSRDFMTFNNVQSGGPLAFPVASGDIPDPVTEDLAWFLVGGSNLQIQAQFFNKAGVRQPTDGKTFRQHESDGFVGDSWKIKSNLTLNYGVRYQYNGVPFETGGNFSNLFQNPDSFATSFTFTEVGPGTGHDMYHNDYSNIEPRVGFAWDPFKTGKTSVRGGYGIFHDRIFDNLFGNARANPPFQQTAFSVFATPTTPEAAPFPTSTPPGLTFVNGQNQIVTLLDPNLRMPASQNWNFGIQRELTSSLVLEADYVGAHATHVIRVLDAVPPDPALIQTAITDCVAVALCAPGDPQGIISGPVLYSGIPSLGIPSSIRENALQTPANFPVTNITRTNSDAHYHALQVKLTKRMSHGLQVAGAYTWAHATDDSNDPLIPEAGQGSFPINSRDPNREFRGNSDNDIRHRGVVDFSYELPFGTGKKFLDHGIAATALGGIAISGIVSAQTGHPYSIFTAAFDNGRNGVASFGWPDVIGSLSNPGPRIQSGGVVTGPPTTAFSSNFLPHTGDSGRNQYYGPHFVDADMVLMKNVRFTERFRMQIRSEFFNLFNHPELFQPGNIVEQPGTFGLSTSTITRSDGTTSARQIQLALKFIF